MEIGALNVICLRSLRLNLSGVNGSGNLRPLWTISPDAPYIGNFDLKGLPAARLYLIYIVLWGIEDPYGKEILGAMYATLNPLKVLSMMPYLI